MAAFHPKGVAANPPPLSPFPPPPSQTPPHPTPQDIGSGTSPATISAPSPHWWPPQAKGCQERESNQVGHYWPPGHTYSSRDHSVYLVILFFLHFATTTHCNFKF